MSVYRSLSHASQRVPLLESLGFQWRGTSFRTTAVWVTPSPALGRTGDRTLAPLVGDAIISERG